MGLNKRFFISGGGTVPMSDQLTSTSISPTGTNCSQQRVGATLGVNLSLGGSTTTVTVELYRSASASMTSPTLVQTYDITASDSRATNFYNFCNPCGWYPGQPYCPNVYFRFTVFDKDDTANTANGSVITI